MQTGRRVEPMMISKIVVIAMGLVAVVPHEDRDRGATILLRDAAMSTPRATLTDGTQCDVHLHVPLVQLAAGECKGDCFTFNVQSASLASVAAQVLGVSGAGASAGPLRWLPFLEHLELEGLGGTSGPHLTDHWFRYGESADAEASDDCQGDATTCPLVARFRMEMGRIKACTLSQYRDNARSGPAGFVLKKFEDVAPDNAL